MAHPGIIRFHRANLPLLPPVTGIACGSPAIYPRRFVGKSIKLCRFATHFKQILNHGAKDQSSQPGG